MANEKKLPGLVELAETHFELSNELDRHMSARNYLYSVFKKEELPAVLEFKSASEDFDHLHTRASIPLSGLPQDVIETLLSYLIEHEEAMAFDCWERILKIAQAANQVVANIKEQKEEAARKIAKEEPIEDTDDLAERIGEMIADES